MVIPPASQSLLPRTRQQPSGWGAKCRHGGCRSRRDTCYATSPLGGGEGRVRSSAEIDEPPPFGELSPLLIVEDIPPPSFAADYTASF